MSPHVEFADVYAYVISADGNGFDIARADWERPKRFREKSARSCLAGRTNAESISAPPNPL
ncbi:MAG: hypothetical protein KDA44_14330 [Planctomycetales bacterium]|nr:hypothetical protein [Planctomycetales bacterium]